MTTIAITILDSSQTLPSNACYVVTQPTNSDPIVYSLPPAFENDTQRFRFMLYDPESKDPTVTLMTVNDEIFSNDASTINIGSSGTPRIEIVALNGMWFIFDQD